MTNTDEGVTPGLAAGILGTLGGLAEVRLGLVVGVPWSHVFFSLSVSLGQSQCT